jgi:hypothetical protein
MAARNATRAKLDRALARLSDALAIISTASDALQAAEDREGSAQPAEIGEHLVCLQHGIAEFRSAFNAIDVGLIRGAP